MELQAELVHAEPGRRVVRVSARDGERALGSALGEAEDAERAEDRARQRLLSRLTGEPSPHADVAPIAIAPVPPTRPAPVVRAPASTARPKPAPAPAAAPETSPTSEPSPTPASTPAPPPTATATATGNEEADADLPPPAATAEPPMDPEDWSQELVQLDLQLQRLGWGREQEGIYLQRAFGHPSRSRLTRWADLTAFLRALEDLAPGADPGTAPVPLRRVDLLQQCDTLLERLGWDTGTARRFLEQHLAVGSRQQLSDAQLLQFNMLLEEAWLAEGSAAAPTPP